MEKKMKRLEKFVLAGPTCDSMDVMYYDIDLPKSTTLGDIVYFHATGAYTTEYGTNFNGIPSPKIIFENGILSDEEFEAVEVRSNSLQSSK